MVDSVAVPNHGGDGYGGMAALHGGVLAGSGEKAASASPG